MTYTPPTRKISLTLLRHGENPLAGTFCGSSDPELTDAGWDMMQRRVEGRTWDQVISSPLKRCRLFAEKHFEPQIEPRFRELDFGEWEAKTTEQVMAIAETQLRAFWANPIDNPPPGGESWGSLRGRVHEGLSDLFEHSEGQSVLIVSHAGAIRAMLCETMGVSYEASWSFSLPLAVLLQLTIYLEDDGKVRAQLHALEGQP